MYISGIVFFPWQSNISILDSITILIYKLGVYCILHPSVQVDFTSCQGLLFVLCMALFFCGIIMGFVVPFGYVSIYTPNTL